MFNALGIRAKTILICIVLSSFTGVVGTASVLTMKEVISKYDRVASSDLPKTSHLAYMWASFREIRIRLRTLGIAGLSEAEAAKAIEGVHRSIADYEKARADYSAMPMGPGEAELVQQAEKEWAAFKAVGARVLEIQKSGAPDAQARMARIFFVDCPQAADRFLAAINALIEFNVGSGKANTAEAKDAARWGNTLSLALLAGSLAAAMGIGFLFARVLARSLDQVAERLTGCAGSVAAVSSRISSSSQALSASATQQAAALQETAASLEQMSSMVTKSADNARRSREFTVTSEQSAHQGKAVVGEMIRAIDEINESNAGIMSEIEASNREIGEIVKVITEIGAKTKVINDIVFQTKLLSFNASVEAARAGEHGKGFAVVAEEVGNLAQMSGNAAKEISSMLEESIRKVEGIVTATSRKVQGLVVSGKAKVDQGTQVARRCGEVLDEIVHKISQVSLMTEEIASASQEQSSGIREINKAMGQLDQVTQQNTSSAQDAEKTSGDLAAQAHQLRESLASLVRTVNGAGRPSGEGPGLREAA